MNTWTEVRSSGFYPAPLGYASENDGPPDEEQVRFALERIGQFCRPRKTLNLRRSSYGLKHSVEGWSRTLGRTFEYTDTNGVRRTSDFQYVTNGAFIVAAMRAGYTAKRTEPGCPNARFNIHIAPEFDKLLLAHRRGLR